MFADVVNSLVGLLVGLLTGYFFERRSSRETRRQNATLQADLRHLRESVYSVGRESGSQAETSRGAGEKHLSLQDSLIVWIREYQGADGAIARARVYQKFINMGFGKEDVSIALAELGDRGFIQVGEMIEVR